MSITGQDFIQRIQAYSKYAKYLPEHNRRETLDETLQRNKDMHLRKYPHLKEEIEENFKLMQEGLFLPAMRSLQFGGEAIEKHNARMFNCFTKNTKFLTSEGYKTFADYEDGDTVVVKTHTGSWKPAKVKSYGTQRTHTVKISKGSQPTLSLRVTGNHRWIKQDSTETTDLKIGDALMAVPSSFNDFDYDSAQPFEKLYWCYGYVFGDGTVTSCGNYSMVRLCKSQSNYAYRFEEMGFKTSSPLSIAGDIMAYTGGYLKQAPDASVDAPELIQAFVAGYLAADGAKSRSAQSHSKYASIVATGKKHQKVVEELFPVAGVFTLSERDLSGNQTNLGVRGDCKFYGLTTHPQSESTANQFRVRELGDDWIDEEVWCLEVEDDHSFVLEQGLVTGNCSYGLVDDVKFFSEAMYLLLCGCGLGYSVRKYAINKLPNFSFGAGWEPYEIEDSIEGWADAVHRIMEWAFESRPMPQFIYDGIRPAGSRLSSGVIAPGPAKLQSCLNQVIDLLWEARKKGSKRMGSLLAHDILCHVADCVVSGGVRRSAMIVLMDWNDKDMLTCKVGNWWEKNPQRARANNSAGVETWQDEATQKMQTDFIMQYAKEALLTGSGDPAVIRIDSEEYGFNPCCEALLYYNSCNLGEIIGKYIKTQEDFNRAAKAGAFWCTLQAGYADFKYLRPIWSERTKKEALIGVGITGVVDGNVLDLDPAQAATIVKNENERVAKLIGINPAHRTTVIKPGGNSTLFAKCYGSGCHDAFSTTSYVRRMRIGKTEPIYLWLMENVPALMEDEAFDPTNTAVLSVPIRVTPGSIKHTTNDDPIKFLERVKWLYDNWIVPGHREGPSTNNVSATCYVTPEQHEEVFQWLWDNRDHYKGVSLLPKDNANYPQMPLEVVPDEVIDELEKHLVEFDPKQIVEAFDMVNFIGEGSCVSGQCNII